MPTYKLDVFVTDAWPYELKQSGYSLCIAKKVNSSYSVVWTAMQDYEFYNEFRWEDSYKLGTIQKFEDGKNLVKMAAAKKQPVTFGQTVVRDHKGILNEATGAPSGKPSFTLQNEGGPTFPIVDQLINNEFKTSWADSLGMIPGYMTLEPRPKVMIFFQKGMKTGDMFATIPGAVVEVDFTGVTEKAVSFVTSGSQGGIWVDGQVVANFVEPVPVSYSAADGFQPLAGGQLTGDDSNGDEGKTPADSASEFS